VIFRQIIHDDLGCASYLVGCHGPQQVINTVNGGPKWERLGHALHTPTY
jgi:hypothetical protein